MFLWDWFAGILNYLGKNSIESKGENSTHDLNAKYYTWIGSSMKEKEISAFGNFFYHFVKVLCC